MKTQTSTESNIVSLNVKIGLAEDQLGMLEKESKEILLTLHEVGTYTHYQQLMKRLNANASLIQGHKLDLKKWRKELQKENEFLVHLQTRK